MARMHTAGKGQSISMKPLSTTVPTFMTKPIYEIKKDIIQHANKGMVPSAIGNLLRDQYGVGNAKDILGKTILEFCKENNCAPIIPEDLNSLIRKSNVIRLHLLSHRKDNDAKYRLNLINSRVHRLVRYYKETSVLPGNWKPVFTAE
ncbi:uncharacterized protein VICG_02031 [Vittaforma corneae ATCC 50505]|uniref:Small ribosomal subunit protein uS15 N-terminal domain-containing protein n=1 Tax=Vittaforma corneae (strain ATCC 50505) TaxID=993615 RepID=L2GKW5_VITCO|nr:uncharacterized protein VICG_02031 [Vittaforma corneae ATCC 50505]ELA40942.1 hypothetical protein VICG_02031 [Vittaforma corneae ATCC 50505]